IYINPVGNNKVSIKKPISISMPASYLNTDMQLFKGAIGDKGNINWNKPTPLQKTAQIKAIEDGKQIFMGNCASCHRIDKDATGPALAYITERRDWNWIKAYTQNSATLIASGD